MSLSPLSLRLTLGNGIAALALFVVMGGPSLIALMFGVCFALGTLIGPLVMAGDLVARPVESATTRALVPLDPLRRLFYGDSAADDAALTAELMATDVWYEYPAPMPSEIVTAGAPPESRLLPAPRGSMVMA